MKDIIIRYVLRVVDACHRHIIGIKPNIKLVNLPVNVVYAVHISLSAMKIMDEHNTLHLGF